MSDYNYYKNNQNNASDDDDEVVSDIPTFSVPIKSKDTSSETVSKDEDKQAPTYDTNFLRQQQIQNEINQENQDLEEDLEIEI